MSNLLDALDSADENPQDGYATSYSYFIQKEYGVENVATVEHTTAQDKSAASDDDLVILVNEDVPVRSPTRSKPTVHRSPGENSPTLRNYRIPKKRQSLPPDNQNPGHTLKRQSLPTHNQKAGHTFNSYEIDKKIRTGMDMSERSPSPVFDRVASPMGYRGGGGGTKRTPTNRRSLPEKRFRGNVTGMNLVGSRTSPHTSPHTASTGQSVKEITIPLVKCDSPQGKRQVTRILRTSLPSSLPSYGGRVNSETNGRIWKYTSPPKPCPVTVSEDLQRQNSIVDLDPEDDSEKIEEIGTSQEVCSADSGGNCGTQIDGMYQSAKFFEDTYASTAKEEKMKKILKPMPRIEEDCNEGVSGLSDSPSDTEMKPEKAEPETYQIAVCQHCGTTSYDLKNCDFYNCRKKIDPSRIKTKTRKKKKVPTATLR